MVALETVSNAYLGGDASLSCSQMTAKEIDDQVIRIVRTQYALAEKLLSENREKLDQISKYLYEKETITGQEFMDILNG